MKQPRAWQRMLSGRRLDLLDPTPVDIEIEDIAHGLAFVARWNGQTFGDWPYSVAEHSLLVEALFARANGDVAPKWRLAALLHDAPEYVIGDMISPVKAAVGPEYGELDARLTAAVHLRFGLPAVLPAPIKKSIKAADRVSAWMEAVQIAGFSEAEADRFFGKPPIGIIAGPRNKTPPAERGAGGLYCAPSSIAGGLRRLRHSPQISRSSGDFPAFSAASIHFGLRPRPVQVSEASFGLAYFGAAGARLRRSALRRGQFRK